LWCKYPSRHRTPGAFISSSILGNNQILCGNIASTNYIVAPMNNSTHPLLDGIGYVICNATATLSTCGNGDNKLLDEIVPDMGGEGKSAPDPPP
jgi:hypothetical protein